MICSCAQPRSYFVEPFRQGIGDRTPRWWTAMLVPSRRDGGNVTFQGIRTTVNIRWYFFHKGFRLQ